MKNTIYIIIAVILVIAIAFLLKKNFLSPPPTSPTVTSPTTTAKEVTIKGTMTCLPHRDTSGPQTMECAFGLKGEDGVYYALHDTDPTYKNIGNIPNNIPVTVSGIFRPGEDARYQSIGTIDVVSVSTSTPQ